MDARTKILDKIFNLRALADSKAATEAEVYAAMAKASKLMDAYDVEEAELAIAESNGKVKLDVINSAADASFYRDSKAKYRRPSRHYIVGCLAGIGRLTNTKMVLVHSYNEGKIDITGDKPDVAYANYLISLCRSSLDSSYAEYRRVTVGVGRGAKAAFQTAMSSRLSSRMTEMAHERNAERAAAAAGKKSLKIADHEIDTSTALVLVDALKEKREEVNALFHKNHRHVTSSSHMGSYRNGTAHSAGHSAANAVNLNRGVGANSSALLA